MTAALGSSSAPLPSLPQPRPWAPRLILGSAPSRFEATGQPSSGPLKAAPQPNMSAQSSTAFGVVLSYGLPLARDIRCVYW